MQANAGKRDKVEQQILNPPVGTTGDLTEPQNSRIIFDIGTMEQAGRVEESVKTGYVEAVIENIVRWIGVEEDLAESYERFSRSLATSKEREAANQLHILSTSDADMLRKRLEEFEGLENEQRKRIQHVKKLSKRGS